MDTRSLAAFIYAPAESLTRCLRWLRSGEVPLSHGNCKNGNNTYFAINRTNVWKTGFVWQGRIENVIDRQTIGSMQLCWMWNAVNTKLRHDSCTSHVHQLLARQMNSIHLLILGIGQLHQERSPSRKWAIRVLTFDVADEQWSKIGCQMRITVVSVTSVLIYDTAKLVFLLSPIFPQSVTVMTIIVSKLIRRSANSLNSSPSHKQCHLLVSFNCISSWWIFKYPKQEPKQI